MRALFRCGACDYEVIEDPDNVELIEEIKDWINYILRAKHSQGHTATFANEHGVPCPTCGEKKRWLNV